MSTPSYEALNWNEGQLYDRMVSGIFQKMVERAGFEPAKAKPADLQSAPVGRLGISPHNDPKMYYSQNLSPKTEKAILRSPLENV